VKLFRQALLLAVVWAGLLGEFSVMSAASGLLIGYLVVRLLPPNAGSAGDGSTTSLTGYLATIPLWIKFLLVYTWQVIRSNFQVAYYVLAPRQRMKPGVIAVPLDVTTDVEITTLMNLITMTPGSLAVDISTDRKVLYVHVLHVDDPDAARRGIKMTLERRVQGVLGR
jgi:multicomponent Na+:H+ antiporter subunit E